jgi:hypothetical protein
MQVCETKLNLLQEWVEATDDCSDIAGSRVIDEQVREAFQEAEERCQRTHEAYLLHRSEHGC